MPGDGGEGSVGPAFVVEVVGSDGDHVLNAIIFPDQPRPGQRPAVSADPAQDLESWGRSLVQPTVRGLVVGRALLYPPDGDVRSAVDAAAAVLRAANAEQGRP